MHFAIITILAFALQNLCCKEYGRRFPDTIYAQAVMTLAATSIVTVIMAALGGVQPLTAEGYAVAIAFGIFFVMTLSVMTIAMNCGHVGVTLLIQNSSLLVPTIFGMLVWNERLTLVKGIGVVCILITLALSAGDASAPVDEATRRRWNKKRWMLFTGLSFLGDSVLNILHGLMSRLSATTGSITFTFWTSLTSVLVALGMIAFFRLRGEARLLRREKLPAFAWTCAGIGLGTAGGNCFTILSLTVLPSVIFYPLQQGALVLLMWLLGILIYREKASLLGKLMLAVGLAGLVLLNL